MAADPRAKDKTEEIYGKQARTGGGQGWDLETLGGPNHFLKLDNFPVYVCTSHAVPLGTPSSRDLFSLSL